jgi:hypothetical protein
MESVSGTDLKSTVQVESSKLLAYDSHDMKVTKDLVPFAQVKRVNNGLKCGCCKKSIDPDMWSAGQAYIQSKELSSTFSSVVKETDLNYARMERCGHEVHFECLLDTVHKRDSCACPVCGECT